MLNIIHSPRVHSGATERVSDFCCFLESHKYPFMMNNPPSPQQMNVIMSIPDLYDFVTQTKQKEDIPKLLKNCYIFVSNLQIGRQYVDLFELFGYAKGLWTHNAYVRDILGEKWKCTFAPMFNFKPYEAYVYPENINPYLYGFYHSPCDVNTTETIRYGHPIFEPSSTLVLASEKYNNWHTTDNDKEFFGKVLTVVDFSSRYSSRHVCSKFLLKAISLWKTILVYSNESILPVMFRQCRDIKITSSSDVNISLIQYKPENFQIERYSNYWFEQVLSGDMPDCYFDYMEGYINE